MPSIDLQVRKPISLRASFLLSMLGAGSMIVIWSILSYGGWIGPLFLPSPTAVLTALINLVMTGELFSALGISFGRILLAMLLTVLVGFPTGVLMGSLPALDHFLEPFTQPMRYIPLTALLPLFILWFGIGTNMKVAFLFAGTVFYFIPLVRNAIRAVRDEYVEVALDIGLSRWEIVRKVSIWAALPQVWAGLIVCNAIGWTYVVLAELINPDKGVGYMISIAGRLQRTDQVLAYVIAISLVALISDRALTAFGKKYLSW